MLKREYLHHQFELLSCYFFRYVFLTYFGQGHCLWSIGLVLHDSRGHHLHTSLEVALHSNSSLCVREGSEMQKGCDGGQNDVRGEDDQ